MITETLLENFYHSTKTLDVTFSPFFNHFSKIDFAVEVVKERKFLHILDLSFDARFVKYY